MPNSSNTVDFKGRVPPQEFEQFREVFPQYGAINWFVNASLAAFNRLIEENPIFKGTVDKAVERMLKESFGTTEEEDQ